VTLSPGIYLAKTGSMQIHRSFAFDIMLEAAACVVARIIFPSEAIPGFFHAGGTRIIS
jgi:hypothetical protein